MYFCFGKAFRDAPGSENVGLKLLRVKSDTQIITMQAFKGTKTGTKRLV